MDINEVSSLHSRDEESFQDSTRNTANTGQPLEQVKFGSNSHNGSTDS